VLCAELLPCPSVIRRGPPRLG